MATKKRSKPADADPASLNVEAFLALFPENIQAVAQQLRLLVRQAVPNLREAVYPGWKLIGYRQIDQGRGRYFCFIAPLADEVRLGFEYGVLMGDPYELLQGTGTQVRYISIRTTSEIQAAAFVFMIAEAADVAAHRRRG
jgi:hypothetical protein